uniref:Uncharacterized protein n=1 Tax=Oryza glumipatula TaxID=40148 RepID=A0A0D9YHB9_9ORYZ
MQAKAPGDQTRGALAGHAVRRSQGRGFGYGHPLPSVVGLPVAEAKRRIKQCRPDVYIEVLSEKLGCDIGEVAFHILNYFGSYRPIIGF